ncbi:MAG TPA: hypothetical protein PK329_00395 [Myxococcota bacterium]|jgi:hypothetical protein|nr:hypothetical protein [Myxococcota bacterium]HON24300.1 hypothetical protein [Myxococcota bacterium]HOS60941.1 hypothetical protein [Myxococcota bacterium]HPC90710.1 hypothetical protein [Myxococcota bacterium]HPL24085.1 hypothetical protein [Myxococcota bacterium]
MRKISLTIALLFVALPSLAKDFGPDLGAFYRTCPGCEAIDFAGYKDWVMQIGGALAPNVGPIASYGSNGYELSIITGLSEVSKKMDYWVPDDFGRPGIGKAPGNLFVTNQIRLRKGLPHGFRIGGSATPLYNSSLWGLSLEVSWAFINGYKHIPDMGFVMAIGTVLGESDLMMIQVHPSFVVSKRFSIAGLFQLTPYFAYNFVFIRAGTHAHAVYRGATSSVEFAFDPINVFRHRLVFGLDATASFVVLGFELGLDVQNTRLNYGLKLGFLF